MLSAMTGSICLYNFREQDFFLIQNREFLVAAMFIIRSWYGIKMAQGLVTTNISLINNVNSYAVAVVFGNYGIKQETCLTSLLKRKVCRFEK